MARVLIGGTSALLICIFLSPKFIEFLRRREFGQHVRDDGPQGHLVKAGTPTMGGVIMMIATLVPFAILSHWDDTRTIGAFAATVACALLGFVDDYMKIVKRRSLGLRARTKLVLLAIVAVGLWLLQRHALGSSGSLLHVRIVDDTLNLGGAYVILVYLVVAGTTSGVNLTDGLDGLAAGCAGIVLMAYVGITFLNGGHGSSNQDLELALLAACLVGACVGFLWFNAFPATIFMGDTGSLGLGGAVAGLAVMTQTEILLLVIGGIFVIEAISVLVQIVAFRFFRKRVLLMAPIHHHFELKAWSETKIILRFWIITAIGAAIGFTIYAHSIKHR
jgi:phospho-N-acetylmuramoyl-pentapeptide-transferase